MSAHTPGPWRVGDHRMLSVDIHPAKYDPTRGAIASVHATSADPLVLETTEANARLIALAPELLDALKACRTALDEEVAAADDLEHPMIRSHSDAADLAHALILKAERSGTVTT